MDKKIIVEWRVEDLPRMYGVWVMRSIIFVRLVRSDAPSPAIVKQRSLLRKIETEIQQAIRKGHLTKKQEENILNCEKIRQGITQKIIQDSYLSQYNMYGCKVNSN
jgi:hypothetical protein